MDPLSLRLRTRTKALHVQAERSGVMALLLRGRATRQDYAAVLVALSLIYEALETALEAQAEDPTMAPLLPTEFARREALAADCASLQALGAALPLPSAVAREYAEHLAQLGREDPPRLLAHAWLRYLGDLHGGQVVGRIVRQSLELPVAATQFYDFPQLEDPMASAEAWRAALDAAPLDAGAQERIVQEACAGFERHIALFEALTPPGAAPRAQDAADSSSAA